MTSSSAGLPAPEGPGSVSGASHLPAGFTDYTAADYADVVGVGLTGFFWITQRAIAAMTTRYGGHVVNVSAAVAGSAGSGTPGVLTAVTEGGLAAATRSLAVEYASFGVRVNAVSPGIIGAPAQVSDIVDGVLFLESSPRITGEILHVAGARRT